MQEYGAITATVLKITEFWKSSECVVIGDSWFCLVQLYNINGPDSIFLVKPPIKYLLGYPNRGHSHSATAIIDEVPLLAVKFFDLQQNS